MSGLIVSLSAVVLIAVAISARSARIEKPDLTPDQLRETSTHIVVGAVKQIWSREESAGGWDFTHYVAEIAVERCEKGDGLQPTQLVYARYWRKRWNGGGAPPADTNGHRGIPKSAERIRVYLARDAYDGFGSTKDHGFNVIGANGFAKP